MKKGAARMKREEKTGRCRKKVESVDCKKGTINIKSLVAILVEIFQNKQDFIVI